jgi:hypothetical protein
MEAGDEVSSSPQPVTGILPDQYWKQRVATSLIGIHVICAYAGANQNQLDILRKPEWSQTLTAEGLSIKTAPEIHGRYGEPTFKVRALNTDLWVTVGASPADPAMTSSQREFVEAGTDKLFTVAPGDTFRWVKAA